MDGQYRRYTITINNPTAEDRASLDELCERPTTEYAIIGNEQGTEGTPHLQAFIHFKTSRRWRTLHTELPRAHIEVAKSGDFANQKYCSKSGDYTEFGRPTDGHSGRRTDLDNIKDLIEEGTPRNVIVRNHCTNFQSVRMVDALLLTRQPTDRLNLVVHWYYGPPGTGKTRTARAEAGADCWMSSGTLRWFQGYQGQKKVILDDLRSTSIDYPHFLRIIDIYPVQVENKGGSIWFEPDEIWITSPQPPQLCFPMFGENPQQIIRRIHDVRHFN